MGLDHPPRIGVVATEYNMIILDLSIYFLACYSVTSGYFVRNSQRIPNSDS